MADNKVCLLLTAEVFVMFASWTSRLYVNRVCATVDELIGTVGFAEDGAAEGVLASDVGATLGVEAAAKEAVLVMETVDWLAAKPAKIVTVDPSVGMVTDHDVAVTELLL